MALFGGSGPQQEIMEGVCALVAMGMLLYTSNWMLNKSSVDAWNRYIRAKTEAAVARIGGTAGTDPTPERLGAAGIVSLALLSFLAVFREGAETVIFYQSIYSMTQDASGMWIGGITAAVGADRRLPAHPVHIGAHPDQTVLHRHFGAAGRACRDLRGRRRAFADRR